MRREVYECDVCKEPKKDCNHWFCASALDDEGFNVREQYFINRSILIAPWITEMADLPGVKHLCGQACVQKFVNKFLAKCGAALVETT